MKSRYRAITENIHDKKNAPTGVLLTNLGTPDAPEASALRRYLAEFLSDPRVVEIPRLIWMIILHGIILRVRPAKSAALYKSIWTEKGSPLMVHSENLTQKVQAVFADKPVVVKTAMRYGTPSIASELQAFQAQGIHKVIVLPLYPQYGGPTTASTFDAVVNELQKWRWIPELHFINDYYDHPLYIKGLADSITQYIAEHGMPDKFVMSYHGMPKQFLEWGDPYYCMCLKTSRLVRELLSFSEEQVITTFQSRFGKAEWLQPYTDKTLESLPAENAKHVAVLCPAFSVDCLETLEEIAEENKEVFINAGGKTYHYIEALNDSPIQVSLVEDLLKDYL